jgi:hypothetical protein
MATALAWNSSTPTKSVTCRMILNDGGAMSLSRVSLVPRNTTSGGEMAGTRVWRSTTSHLGESMLDRSNSTLIRSPRSQSSRRISEPRGGWHSPQISTLSARREQRPGDPARGERSRATPVRHRQLPPRGLARAAPVVSNSYVSDSSMALHRGHRAGVVPALAHVLLVRRVTSVLAAVVAAELLAWLDLASASHVLAVHPTSHSSPARQR